MLKHYTRKTPEAGTVTMRCCEGCSRRVCACVPAQVPCLQLPDQPQLPFPLQWSRQSAFQELLLSFNKSLGPLVRGGGQRAAKSINWKFRVLMRTGKTLGLLKWEWKVVAWSQGSSKKTLPQGLG